MLGKAVCEHRRKGKGMGGLWEISVSSSQFYREPKTALEYCLQKKGKK